MLGETVSAGSNDSTSVLNPGGISPAPGPVTKGPDGRPTGPQFTKAPGDSPQDLQKKFQADRLARGKEAIAKTVGEDPTPEADGAIATDATEEVASVDEGQAQDPVGQDATAEKSRADRVAEAVRKAKSQASRHKQVVAENAKQNELLQQNRARMQQLENQVRRGQELERLSKTDPLKFLQESGVTPDQLAQRVMLAGTPEEKFSALQAQLEAERNERVKLENSIKTEKQQQRYAENMKSVEDLFMKRAANVEKYPNLQGLARSAILGLGKQVAQETRAKYIKETGVAPTISDQQLLAHLNKILGKKSVETPSASKVSTKSAPSKAAKSTGTASTKPATPRTLTSSQAAGSFSRPANWDQLSRTERVNLLRQDTARRSG
jgi:hypothetical protein